MPRSTVGTVKVMNASSKHLRLVAVCLLVASAACGDSPGSVDPGSDAGISIGPDAADAGLYGSPADFDRTGCDASVALDQVDVAGIWHLDINLPDFGSWASVLRIDESLPIGFYTALLFGAEATEVRIDATDLFVRRAWWSESNGYNRVRAITGCAVRPDGSVYGKYATCRDAECFLGEFVAYKVDPIDEPVATGMTLVAEWSGPPTDPWPTDAITANVRYHKGFAYVARYGDGLRIVDVTNPAAPVERGHLPTLGSDFDIHNDVKMIEGNGKVYAVMASSVQGAVVVDVSDPDNPTRVATFPRPASPRGVEVHTVFIEGTRAYITNISTSGVDIYDLTDPENPVKLGEWVHPDVETRGGYPHDLFVEAGRVYINYWGLGMVIIDTQGLPAAPSLVGVFDSYATRRTSHSNWVTTAGGRKISVHGDEDFASHVRIVDVDDETSVAFLNEIGSYETRPSVSVHNIMAVGELALVTHYQDGLRVLDLSNPTKPKEIAHYATWPGAAPGYGRNFYEGAIGVDYDPETGRIFLADTHRGLFILTLDP